MSDAHPSQQRTCSSKKQAAIRKVVRRLLESVGHRVTTVSGTREAVGLARRAARRCGGAARPLDARRLGETIVPDLRRHLPNAQILLFAGQDVEPEVAALADSILVQAGDRDNLLRAVEGALQGGK